MAKGIVACMEHPAALNEDFNISTPVATTVRELAEVIWRKVHGTSKPLRLVFDAPFEHDVQVRSPATEKAGRVLGIRCDTSLDQMLDEVIPWVKEAIAAGRI